MTTRLADISHLASRIAGEIEQVVAGARRETAELLNQASRRIRQCETEEDVLAALLDATAPFCERAALLTIGEGVARLADATITLDSAPAVATAVSSADTVVSLRTAGELSELVTAALGEASDQKALLLPVTRQGKTVAVLCATAGDAAPLELLASVAGAALDARLAAPPVRPPDLVSITGVPEPTPKPAVLPEWRFLSPEEQRIHLRAQRFARVRAAEMQSHKSEAVRAGRDRRDLYRSLRAEIDAAREAFHLQYFAACPTMVDYLHLELVRTLAKNDDALLGPDYPGPLAS